MTAISAKWYQYRLYAIQKCCNEVGSWNKSQSPNLHKWQQIRNLICKNWNRKWRFATGSRI